MTPHPVRRLAAVALAVCLSACGPAATPGGPRRSVEEVAGQGAAWARVPDVPLSPRTDPGLAQAQIAQATQKRSGIMPDQTRELLERLADTMLRASGQKPLPVSAPGSPSETAPPAASSKSKARDPKLAPPPGAKQGSQRSDASGVGRSVRP